MKQLPPNAKLIGSGGVVIQSCWLDEDGDIPAHVGLEPAGRTITYYHLRLNNDGSIVYPEFAKRKAIGRHLTWEEFDKLLRDNIVEIKVFIVDLLEPKEKALYNLNELKKTMPPLRDFWPMPIIE